MIRQRQTAAQESRADQFVDGIVATDILAHIEQSSVGSKQAGGMQSASAVNTC
jgi:hypothetical protein